MTPEVAELVEETGRVLGHIQQLLEAGRGLSGVAAETFTAVAGCAALAQASLASARAGHEEWAAPGAAAQARVLLIASREVAVGLVAILAAVRRDPRAFARVPRAVRN